MKLRVGDFRLNEETSKEVFLQMNQIFDDQIFNKTFPFPELLGPIEEFTYEAAQAILTSHNYIIRKRYFEDDKTGEPINRFYIIRATDDIDKFDEVSLYISIEREMGVGITCLRK